MIWLAAASIAALALVTVAALQTISRMLRGQARERDLLINQICSLAGKPWLPPPAADQQPENDREEQAFERFTMTPGQLPDHWGTDEP